MSGINDFLMVCMVKPPPLTFRGSLEEAEDLATHGLGGTCRITNCDGREYRRSRGISERGRVAA